jgi:hypothetical protein
MLENQLQAIICRTIPIHLVYVLKHLEIPRFCFVIVSDKLMPRDTVLAACTDYNIPMDDFTARQSNWATVITYSDDFGPGSDIRTDFLCGK